VDREILIRLQGTGKKYQAMVISGEPDPASASLEDWVNYREHLRSLPAKDDSVSVALAIANTQIRKLQATQDQVITV
jgi:hypothetical protein